MKNLLLVLLFVLPTALFSATPSCLAGMEVSLIDGNGKVIKSGKFDDKGELTLDGLGDASYSIRVTKNGKSCVLDKPKSGEYSGLPTGKRMHKPFSFKISEQKGGSSLLPASNVKASSRSDGNVESADDWTKTSKKKQNVGASDNGGVDQDCDDIEFTIIAQGNGKATFKEFTITK